MESVLETKPALRQFEPIPPGTSTYLPVDEIVVDHDANSRKYSAGKIEEMANSILTGGQLQPIRITNITRRVVFGYRRAAAVAYINEHKMYKPKEHTALANQAMEKQVYIRVEVVPELSDEEMFLANIEENDAREDTTPIDRANQMVRLTKPKEEGGFGYTQAQCAEKMSVSRKTSQATVSRFLKVMEQAPAWAVWLVHEGKRPMENLIEAVGHPAGSKERDTALEQFKAGETAAATRAKVRETAGKEGKDEGEETAKRGSIARSRAEIMAAFEEWAAVPEGSVAATPFEEVFAQLLKFAAGKAGARKTQDFIADRIKAKLAKAAA